MWSYRLVGSLNEIFPPGVLILDPSVRSMWLKSNWFLTANYTSIVCIEHVVLLEAMLQ